ncbi:hypothetical protein ACUODF_60040, partial [Escherichia coli]
DKLRKNHYHGLPFKVTNYFEFIAREYMTGGIVCILGKTGVNFGATNQIHQTRYAQLCHQLAGFTGNK